MTTNSHPHPSDSSAPAGRLAQHLPLSTSSFFHGDVYLKTKEGLTLGSVDESCGEEIKNACNTYASSQRKIGELRRILSELYADFGTEYDPRWARALALLKATE